jgi:hypothetical protein
LFLDEVCELRRQQDGIAFDGEVRTSSVTVEAVGGQLDEAGDGNGVEPDQCAGDRYFEWKSLIVEASFQLVVVLLVTEEPGR